mmetsp:Transcript_4702/g.11882  ORF Transcript_4702/g.11882 Transcript_4702/m.11882 type:complete len:212 (-) Transcript_4702:836-1471(-)
MAECVTFSSRTFISSWGRTSGTSSAPAFSHGGRAPSTKLSSITQCLYGSHITGHASSMPARRLRSAMSAGDVAGVMRSTMVLGYLTSSSSHRVNAATAFCSFFSSLRSAFSSSAGSKSYPNVWLALMVTACIRSGMSAAAASTRFLATSPLCGRLSQDMMVKGRRPVLKRTASAAMMRPNTVALRYATVSLLSMLMLVPLSMLYSCAASIF